jgi:hypothetical protein
MKNHGIILSIAMGCLMMLSACAADKMTYERGWLGGKYLESNTSLIEKLTENYFKVETGVIPILPNKIKERQSGALFVSRVFADTPVMQAGAEKAI